MRSPRLRFLLLFFALLALFEIPLLLRPVEQNVIRPVTMGIASAAGSIISAFGQQAVVHGTTIAGRCFSVEINYGCNGIEATIFLVAAILAFPASTSRRAAAAALGALLIQVLNMIRVVSLYFIGCYRREWFESAHLVFWQTVIFAVTVLYFVQWTRYSQRADAATAA